MTVPRAVVFATIAVFACMGVVAAQETGGPIENQEGHDLAAEVFKAAGGDAWKETRGTLVFDFIIATHDSEVVRFRHRWTPTEDRYTVRGPTRDGGTWSMNFTSLSRREGRAELNGKPVPDSLRERLESLAYGRHINDSYWLMMPVKLLDPGVHHARLADTTINGDVRNVLMIWFDNVGLTPGDRYWIFVDPHSHQVVGWRFRLQSGRTDRYTWTDVKTIGPLRLPTVKRSLDGDGSIRFEASWER